MNATLTSRPVRHEHPPQQIQTVDRPVRRVTLIDRLALRVGIALIQWGRRPHPAESRERRARKIEQVLAQQARERSAERTFRLVAPPR